MMKEAKNLQPTEQLSLQTETKPSPKPVKTPRNADNQKTEPEKVFIPCDKLIIDEKQPFRLYNQEKLKDLAERIKQSGLLSPIIVRPAPEGMYEVLSGRNRLHAIMLNGGKEIAAFIRNVSDDEAKMIMLNANLGQRENLLPSEKAKAYAMEAEILNRNGKRPDSTFGKDCQSYDARKIMSEKHNESGRSIANYIRLAYLNPELLSLVDEKKLPLLTGVELSYLSKYEQQILFNLFISKGLKPNAEQLSGLRKLSKEKKINIQALEEFFEKPRKSTKKEYIKLDKSKFSQFADIINNAKNLEQQFINFLHAQKRMKGGEFNAT
jgi:ParB family chromosome partitioning protein